MDPVTQGLLGAAAAQAVLGRRVPNAWLVGAVGGLLPDADVFIQSSTDPLLAVEYHRGFTHALAFIPFGGFIAALPWIARRRYRNRWTLMSAVIGYATHGLLDACTTYGTQLFWPFSSYRVSWNFISIIDPVFTVALLIGVVWAARSHTQRPAAVVLAFCGGYLALGALQHGRALEAQQRIAAFREHSPLRGESFPTIANNLVWRSLYRAGDSLYADRIRVPWIGPVKWTAGTSVLLEDGPDSFNPRIERDFERFRWFSDGWVARAPRDSTVIGDARYSLRTDAFEPIWGVRFHPDKAVPTQWVDRTRDRDLDLGELQSEIVGTHPAYKKLPGPPR